MGGGPPASRPRRELCSARRLEARPGPAPRSVPYPQFCMQFPDTCSSSLSEKPGISMITFQSMKCVRGNCMRICVDRALPPPTGTADRPSGPSGALHTGDAWRAEVWLGAVPRSPARPRRRPSISHVIPLRLVQTLNLHRWNCNVFGVLWCVLLQKSSIQGVFRVDFCPVVTNVVNPRGFSLVMVVFGLRLTTFVIGVLARRLESRWFDDVCNVGCPLVARPGGLLV